MNEILKDKNNETLLNIKNEIDEEIIQYITNKIFPLYSRNEEGHGIV